MAHSRAAITTAPNMVMGISIGSAGNSPQSTSMQMDGGGKRESMRNNNSSPSVAPSGGGSNSSHSLNSATTSRQIEDPQTAAQRQAAAKLALRKQLEKTLLQVHHLDSTTSMSNYQINPGNDWNFFFFFCKDSSSEASTAGDALYSEPKQHRVYLFIGSGSCRRSVNAGHRSSSSSYSVHLFPVRNGFLLSVEVGQSRYT